MLVILLGYTNAFDKTSSARLFPHAKTVNLDELIRSYEAKALDFENTNTF